jgi:hypothetical protein
VDDGHKLLVLDVGAGDGVRVPPAPVNSSIVNVPPALPCVAAGVAFDGDDGQLVVDGEDAGPGVRAFLEGVVPPVQVEASVVGEREAVCPLLDGDLGVRVQAVEVAPAAG